MVIYWGDVGYWSLFCPLWNDYDAGKWNQNSWGKEGWNWEIFMIFYAYNIFYFGEELKLKILSIWPWFSRQIHSSFSCIFASAHTCISSTPTFTSTLFCEPLSPLHCLCNKSIKTAIFGSSINSVTKACSYIKRIGQGSAILFTACK